MQTKTSIERLQALLPDVFEPQAKTGQLYLGFRVGSVLNAAFPLGKVVETLQVSASSITPLPNMPASVLGLMNNQDKIFWAIDLAFLLGVRQEFHHFRQYNMIIVEMLSIGQDNDSLLLGLAVDQIQSTLRLDIDKVEPPNSDHSRHLLPYLDGQLWQQGKEILLLNLDAIFSAQDLYLE
ncbi:MAG: chemotaxis protein CheW [Cyanobacteria bacterium P01_F01_bin.86]